MFDSYVHKWEYYRILIVSYHNYRIAIIAIIALIAMWEPCLNMLFFYEINHLPIISRIMVIDINIFFRSFGICECIIVYVLLLNYILIAII